MAKTSPGDRQLEARIQAVEQKRAVQDGRLEVAAAIAMLSTKVTVHLTPTLSMTPANLFDLTFDDSQVGLTDNMMPAFKDLLALRLPQIATQIQNDIPDDANVKIRLVATLVHVALLAHREAQG
jgi:hypothetical protein